MKMDGAQLTIRLLERQGIRTIAGIPGGANLPLYDALGQSTQIRHILARHEQGAGFIAQGMARITGKPEVCFATSGPGATNAMTAIADAFLDSIPMICITGQVPYSMIGTDAFQEVDTYGMSTPITKHNFLIRSAEEILTVIPEAFRIAMSGRPGPVLIDMPKNLQKEMVEFNEWPEPGKADPMPELDQAELKKATEMIDSSERPVLYIGGGIIFSDASEALRQLAEKSNIPTTTTLMGLGAMRTDHPLYLGMLGMHGARHTNLCLEECDLLITIGARFDDRATGKVSAFCPTAKIIHIDIDPGELHKIKTAHVGIVGDAREALESLAPQIEPQERTEWLTRIEELKEIHPPTPWADNGPQNPYGLVRHTARVLDDDAIIVTDVGQHQMWAAQAYPFRKPRRWLTSGGLGTMGFGLPTAIGAAMADPESTTVCFSGDGSILMNIQELATAAEENANVKIVLMNNNALGLVTQQQDLFYGKRIYESIYRKPTDFCKIAEGFGIPVYDLAASFEPEKTLEQAMNHQGPCLIHAPIDISEQVYPMVPPGAANKDMIGGEVNVTTCAK